MQRDFHFQLLIPLKSEQIQQGCLEVFKNIIIQPDKQSYINLISNCQQWLTENEEYDPDSYQTYFENLSMISEDDMKLNKIEANTFLGSDMENIDAILQHQNNVIQRSDRASLFSKNIDSHKTNLLVQFRNSGRRTSDIQPRSNANQLLNPIYNLIEQQQKVVKSSQFAARHTAPHIDSTNGLFKHELDSSNTESDRNDFSNNDDIHAMSSLDPFVEDVNQPRGIIDIHFDKVGTSDILNELYTISIDCGDEYGVIELFDSKIENTIMEIKNKILKQISVEDTGYRLSHNNKLQVNFRTLGDCQISTNSILKLVNH